MLIWKKSPVSKLSKAPWNFCILEQGLKKQGKRGLFHLAKKTDTQVIWEQMGISIQNKTEYYIDSRLCPMKN